MAVVVGGELLFLYELEAGICGVVVDCDGDELWVCVVVV